MRPLYEKRLCNIFNTQLKGKHPGIFSKIGELKNTDELKDSLQKLKTMLPPEEPLLFLEITHPLHELTKETSPLLHTNLPNAINQYGSKQQPPFRICEREKGKINRSVNHNLVQIGGARARQKTKFIAKVEEEVFGVKIKRRNVQDDDYFSIPYRIFNDAMYLQVPCSKFPPNMQTATVNDLLTALVPGSNLMGRFFNLARTILHRNLAAPEDLIKAV